MGFLKFSLSQTYRKVKIPPSNNKRLVSQLLEPPFKTKLSGVHDTWQKCNE